MTSPFMRPASPPEHWGFTVGILRLAWAWQQGELEHQDTGRRPRATAIVGTRDDDRAAVREDRLAMLTECQLASGVIPRDDLNRALLGALVRSPQGGVARIVGVESPCTAGITLGEVLVPVLESYDAPAPEAHGGHP